MKENKLKIRINKPVNQVFEFTTNPANTHKWINSIVKETTNEWPISLGSKYINTDSKGNQNEYIVVELEQNKHFALQHSDNNYFVKYTYTPISDSETELEYYEWVLSGELNDPFEQSTLKVLKFVIEADVKVSWI